MILARSLYRLLAPALTLALVLGQGGAATARPRAHAAKAPQSAAGEEGPGFIAAADGRAVDAGLAVLRAGGSAVDAAVAVQAVLGLVEPQSSGLAGGAFMVLREGRTGRVVVYDGRETAPAGATPDMFMGPDGKPLSHFVGVLSGRSTGPPGAVAMLAMAQRAHGRLAWRALFGDAERLADAGFVVQPRLARFAAIPQLRAAFPDAAKYLTGAGGGPAKVGDVIRNPAYAATLRGIAARGPAGLLNGPVAADIAARVAAPPLPGTLNVADMAAYRPVERAPLCRPYRAYRICGAPPPAGGVGLLELMALLERTDIARRGPRDPQAWFTFAQAQRLMYADRDRYVADPAFVSVPTEGLLDPSYIAARAALIPTVVAGEVAPGKPARAGLRAPDRTAEPGGTSSLVIADRWGDVVSMTTTVESVFGSGRMVDGFFLNNQLTDFSFSPREADGAPAANAVAPGKRPRSSMTPVIVLDRRGRLVMAVGSPGGNTIIAYVAKALVGVLDWGLTPQAAVDLPNMVARGPTVQVEAGRFDPAVAAELRRRGLTVEDDPGEDSGLQALVRRPDGALEGAADRRREGVARALTP